jgi:hypothetical protein
MKYDVRPMSREELIHSRNIADVTDADGEILLRGKDAELAF